jgi:S-formylglutathione hydrolase
MTLETLSTQRSFGGTQGVYRHGSAATGTAMTFSVFVPPQAAAGAVPVLWWLSGLTCTWENATTKAGFQGPVAEHGLIVVCPDTSPRGLELPGEHDA